MIYVGFGLAVAGGMLVGAVLTLVTLNWAWRGSVAWDRDGDDL